jgi:hypothetical protein
MRFNGSRRQAWRWIMQIAKIHPDLFVHWRLGFVTA